MYSYYYTPKKLGGGCLQFQHRFLWSETKPCVLKEASGISASLFLTSNKEKRPIETDVEGGKKQWGMGPLQLHVGMICIKCVTKCVTKQGKHS